MRVDAFLRTIYVPSRVKLSATYVADLAAAVRMFSEHLGRQAKLADLTTPLIGAFLAAYSAKWSAKSTNAKRQSLLCLARAAYDHVMIAEPLRDRLIRKLPVDHTPPRAWTVEQVGQLIYTANQLPGSVGDVPAALWWPALFDAVYWSACRIGAMLTARTEDYANGFLLVGHQKNGQSQLYRLPKSCCQLIDATKPSGRELLFPWPWGRRWLFSVARKVVEAAMLPCPKTGRQIFHCLRRSSISYCAAIDPGIAQRQANHADYATTKRSYVDASIAHQRCAADVCPDPLTARPAPTFRIYG